MQVSTRSATIVAAFAAAVLPISVCAQTKPSYSIPGIEVGGFVDKDGRAAELKMQIPIVTSAARAFFLGADARLFKGSLAELSASSYNVGAYGVVRQRFNDGVIGGWAGADVFRSNYGNTFPRFIAGAEFFGPRVIARLNGFVPLVNNKNLNSVVTTTTATATSTSSSVVDTGGGTSETAVTTTQTVTTESITDYYKEFAPSGFDAELGLRHRFVEPTLPLGLAEARLFAGGYRYNGLNDDGGNVNGLRGRLELDFYPIQPRPDVRLTMGYELSHDDYRQTVGTFSMRLAVPLGGPQLTQSAQHGGSLKDDHKFAEPARDTPQTDLFQPVKRNTLPLTARRLVASDKDTKTSSNTTVVSKPNVMADFNMLCGGSGASIQVVDATGAPIVFVADPIYANDPSIMYWGANYGNQTTTLAALGLNLNTVSALQGTTSLAAIKAPVSVPVSINSTGGFTVSTGGNSLTETISLQITSFSVSSAGCRAVGIFSVIRESIAS
jgi:hypothetical protein